MGSEILKQAPHSDQIDTISATAGGGGLVACIDQAPNKVIDVEILDGDAMVPSIASSVRVTLPEVGPFHTVVQIVGTETFRTCKQLPDEIVLVDSNEICAFIKDILKSIFFSSEAESRMALLCWIPVLSLNEPGRSPLLDSSDTISKITSSVLIKNL